MRCGGPLAWRKGFVELVVIACMNWLTHPLFAIGLYFLVWHGWRQMQPLAESLTGATPRSSAALGHAVALIHWAALPLLVPAWAAIGASWWLWSPDRSARSLAIVSIAAYLVVTPAHEFLGELLRQMAGRRLQPSLIRPPVRLTSGPATAGPTSALAKWLQPAASSRKTPIFRNFS